MDREPPDAGAALGFESGVMVMSESTSGWPHLGQKAAPSGLAELHFGQVISSWPDTGEPIVFVSECRLGTPSADTGAPFADIARTWSRRRRNLSAEVKGEPMSIDNPRSGSSRVAGGVLLVLVGSVFVLQNAGLVQAGRVWDWWPMLLVWLGLSRLLAPNRGHHFASGVVLLVLGIGLQLDQLGFIWLRLRDFWPVLLVLAGLALISESLFHPRGRRRDLDGSTPAGRGNWS